MSKISSSFYDSTLALKQNYDGSEFYAISQCLLHILFQNILNEWEWEQVVMKYSNTFFVLHYCSLLWYAFNQEPITRA